jgi:threonine dehydratase
MTMTLEPVTLPTVRDAHSRIAHAIYHTPLVPLGDNLYAKAENLQRTGAFKLRGAYNFLANLDPEVRARGVVAYSSGNHAQGVACAAHLWGVPAAIVIPNNAPAIKVTRTEAWGAEVIRCDVEHSIRETLAKEIAETRGYTLVPPFDHPWIIAGQGTAGLEILADMPDVDNVLVCTGGGGLLAGVAVAIKSQNDSVRVYGVEPELAADAAASMAKGERVMWESARVSQTIADGVRTRAVGEHNFALMQQYVDGVLTVSEAAIIEATRAYVLEHHLVVEPTGALALAAWNEHDLVGKTVLMVSGGNIEPTLLQDILAG